MGHLMQQGNFVRGVENGSSWRNTVKWQAPQKNDKLQVRAHKRYRVSPQNDNFFNFVVGSF